MIFEVNSRESLDTLRSQKAWAQVVKGHSALRNIFLINVRTLNMQDQVISNQIEGNTIEVETAKKRTTLHLCCIVSIPDNDGMR